MPEPQSTHPEDRNAKRLFRASIALVVFGYGVCVGALQWFPYAFIEKGANGFREIQLRWVANNAPEKLDSLGNLPWYFKKAEARPPRDPSLAASRQPGLTLVTQMGVDLRPDAVLLDEDDQVVHQWDLDWFKIWPDADHLPASLVPKSRPGTHIHGAVILENGDLVFNYEYLGLVRVDRDGNVVWRLAYGTHHSVHLHDDGSLWVCGQRRHEAADDLRFPGRKPPFDEFTILQVSQAGEIMEEWSVGEILAENGLSSLLRIHTPSPTSRVMDDRLHVNDAEPFPESFEEDFFKHGDVLISLRNINTVMVFNRETRKVRFACTGWFEAQHDPDFVDGNRFSVFDNRTLAKFGEGKSRIVMVSARERSAETVYEGSSSARFFSKIMGKHQWLPNGNLLVTESCEGRAIELDPQGRIVWDYRNYIGDDEVAITEQVERLSPNGTTFSPQKPTTK